VIEPGKNLIVPEYIPQLDFKTKLNAATDKIKAYRAFFYDRAERGDTIDTPDNAPEVLENSIAKKRHPPRFSSKSSKSITSDSALTANLSCADERQPLIIDPIKKSHVN
jgi:hypothetical protein